MGVGLISAARRRTASAPFDPATLFTGGEIGDWWVFDNVHTDQPTLNSSISSATGLVNSHVLGFADAANKPLLVQPSGSLYAARFDGGGDRLFWSVGSTVTQPGTIILAIAGSSTSTQVFATGSSTSSRWQISANSSNDIILFAGSTLDTTRNVPIGTGASAKVIAAEFNGASSRSRFNGTTTVTGNAGTQSTNRLTIGALYDGTFGASVDIFAALFINRLLTATELDNAERALGAYAGLTW